MTDWNKEETLAALTYPIDLPKAAWQLALQHYDDIKNELYAALKLSPERIYALSAKHGSSYDLQFFAFYMVAEKRDTQALPLICDFFAKYGKEASKVTGDMATEDLPKILASVGFEQADVLYQHASTDSGMDIWGKGACIDALGILMHHGYLPREQLLDWYIDLLQSKLEADLIESMIFNCIRLGFEECKATILKLIEQGYDIKHRFDIADIHNIKKGKIEEAYVHQHLSMIDNSLDLLHRFYDTESGSNQPSSSISFLSMDETIPLLPLLKHLPDEDGIAYLHGYVYAVVYTPEVIMPSEWLDPLLKNITFGSNEKTSSLMSGLMQVYNRLNEQRLESLLKCPITKEHFTNARTFDDIESWSRGFLDGIKHRPWLWGAEESVREEKLSDIDVAWTIMLAIVDADIAEEMLQKSKKPDDGEQERVAFYASLYGGFLSAEQTMVDYVRAQEGESSGILPNVIPLRSHKVGRNKPCTCGSGKKFKKCCGSAARTVH